MNYSEMSDEELRLLTAKRLGWTEIEEDEWFEECYWDGGMMNDLTGIPPKSKDGYKYERSPLPDWPYDLSSAWELFAELPRGVLYRCDERAGVEYMIDYLTLRSITAAQPARAITEAWNVWMDER